MKKYIVIVLTFVALAAVFILSRNSQTLPLSLQQNLSLSPQSTPEAAVPFIEMTIPALRARNYTGTLNSRQQLSESANYTSYLTSYQSDNLKINGLLTIPKGEAPEGGWPAIVFVHGYIAPTIYKTTERYVDYVNYLARNGFVVFKIDLRGHGSSEGEPSGAYYSSDYVIDTLNAYNALATASFVNPKQIGLWGHSMAGNVTTRALAVRPDIPALVVWAGAGYTYTDLSAYRINDRSYRPPVQNTEVVRKRDQLMKTHGQFDPNNSFWKQFSITDYVNDIRGAIQIHHAVNDTVVSVEYSRNLMKLLDNTSVSHELFEYPTGGHNIDGASFSSAMSRTTEFYKSRLQQK